MTRAATLPKKKRGPADRVATVPEGNIGEHPLLSATSGDVAASGVSASPTNPTSVVLLDYQQQLLAATARNRVVVCEKSRRIGATWGVAADAVLTAGAERRAGGMDVFYVGFNRDMTREFIDTCAMWSKHFSFAAEQVEEFLFREQGEDGGDREIQAFRIRMGSSFEIVALCSRPRALRGRQGYVIVDEAAFHDDLLELLKAALALLIWGGKVLVISTHDGVDNPFAILVDDCRTGRRPFHLLRTTFDDALAAGLYRRVCEVKGEQWTAEAESTWAAEIRSFYGDGASEELDCVPRQSGGRYIPRTLLEARSKEGVPVLRLALEDAFVDWPEERRIAHIDTWFTAEVVPHLPREGTRSVFGMDFGRNGDLSVLWPLVVLLDLRRSTPFVLELRNVPFTSQQQIVNLVADRLVRFGGAAFDARGNGQYLAEVTRQRYGSTCVEQVMLSEGWYREWMPPMKAALEDAQLDLPRDAEIIDDLRALEVVRGVARVPEKATQAKSGQRHGDAAVAVALANFAAATLDAGPVRLDVVGQFTSTEGFAGDLGRRNLAGWN